MTGARILMVDDELEVCRIVERMLTNGRYQVEVSQSVADAIEAIDQRPFDLYVLDFKLRDGCGLEIAERIRSKKSGAPIILLSGCHPDSIALRAQELGIVEMIEKPFSREMIFHAVQKAIGSPAEAVT
jgi:two-component system, NtrC family, response regulator HydG